MNDTTCLSCLSSSRHDPEMKVKYCFFCGSPSLCHSTVEKKAEKEIVNWDLEMSRLCKEND